MTKWPVQKLTHRHTERHKNTYNIMTQQTKPIYRGTYCNMTKYTRGPPLLIIIYQHVPTSHQQFV